MPHPRIAVVGGGVSACSLAYALRDQLASKTLSLTLFEMGRGPGGRASTRTTREFPDLHVDHGAPSFSARTAPFIQLCHRLTEANVLQRVEAPLSFGTITANGSFVA